MKLSKTLILTISALIVPVLFTLLVGLWAKQQRPIHGGGFNRLFLTDTTITPLDTLPLNNSFYFAGTTGHHVYLGSITGPRTILQVNTADLDTQKIVYTISETKGFIINQIRVAVDSPNFYMGDGTVPIIYKGKLSESIVHPFVVNCPFFIDYVPFADSSFVIVSINRTKERLIGKMQANGKAVFAKGLLEKQVDGFFCTEGEVIVDQDQLAYIYNYRNKLFITDSNLKMYHESNTIDTITQTTIRVSTIDDDQSSGLSSPPTIVNKNATVYKIRNLLLINSLPLAENEKENRISKAAAIDVYTYPGTQYQFSFYIPFYKNEKVKDFRVTRNAVAVLYSTALVTFSFDDLKLFAKETLHANQEEKTEHL